LWCLPIQMSFLQESAQGTGICFAVPRPVLDLLQVEITSAPRVSAS
jgi:hypothetical protein